jgi:hypothetical protein
MSLQPESRQRDWRERTAFAERSLSRKRYGERSLEKLPHESEYCRDSTTL